VSYVDQAIFQVKAMVENTIGQAEAHQEKLALLIRVKQLKEKRLSGQKLTAEEVNEVLKIVCWKNLAGCCAPEKECPWQMAACEAVGVDPVKLYEAKTEIVKRFLG
jgi:hypothetical protein